MKKLMITAIALFSATLMLSAQETGKTGRFHHGKHMNKKHHGVELNLSAEQKEQAKSYRKEFKDKMDKLNKNDQMTVKDFRAQRDAIMREQKEKMSNLLTAEQKQKMKESRQKMAEAKKAKMQKHFDKMSEKLALTGEQKSQFKSQHEATRQQMKSLKENQSYTREQKKQMMHELKKKNHESFMAGLTETQKKQLEEMKKNKKNKRMIAK